MSASRTWAAQAYWLTVINGCPHVYTTKDAAFTAGRKAKTFVYRQDARTGMTTIVLDSDGTENPPGKVKA